MSDRQPYEIMEILSRGSDGKLYSGYSYEDFEHWWEGKTLEEVQHLCVRVWDAMQRERGTNRRIQSTYAGLQERARSWHGRYAILKLENNALRRKLRVKP